MRARHSGSGPRVAKAIRARPHGGTGQGGRGVGAWGGGVGWGRVAGRRFVGVDGGGWYNWCSWCCGCREHKQPAQRMFTRRRACPVRIPILPAAAPWLPAQGASVCCGRHAPCVGDLPPHPPRLCPRAHAPQDWAGEAGDATPTPADPPPATEQALLKEARSVYATGGTRCALLPHHRRLTLGFTCAYDPLTSI